MFYKIGLAFLVIVGIFCGIAYRQPAEFRVQRAIAISAPPAAIFAEVNDLHHWHAWSPWAKLDPNARMDFEGPASGVGAIMRWSGNKEVGVGSMTILESRKNEFIKFKLDFLKPLPGTSTADFAFTPAGDHTIVAWSMYGKNNFIAKAVSLFMNCDKMVGGQFDKGLMSLKSIVEASPAAKMPAPVMTNAAPTKSKAAPAKSKAAPAKSKKAPAKKKR